MTDPEDAALTATEKALEYLGDPVRDLDVVNTYIALGQVYALLDIANALRSFE